MTFIPGLGTSIHGSHRWIYIAGFGFQPSEALKMALSSILVIYSRKRNIGLRHLRKDICPCSVLWLLLPSFF